VSRSTWTQTRLVWRKEILDTLRDRRTIMAMIVVPLLVYPILIIGISQLGIRQVQKIRASTARVALVPPDASPGLRRAFAADTSYTVVDSEDPEAALQDRRLDAVVTLPRGFADSLAAGVPAEISVRVDLSRDRGKEISDRVEGFLGDWRRDMVEKRLAAADLPVSFVRPFTITIDNAAGAKRMGGSLMGQILPVILVVMMMSGALYPAIDVTAGERERGTLETLLVSPGDRFSIVLGKYLTVFTASMVTTLANLVSIAFTVFYLIGSAKLGGAMGQNLPALIDWRSFFLVFLIMIPMALFFCGLAMVVASFARSFKEAQNYLSPLLIACIAPAYLALLPGFEVSYEIALIPIANVVLLSREFLLGSYPWDYFAITLAVMTGLALLMLRQAVVLFAGEGMLGGAEGGLRLRWHEMFHRDRSSRAETLTPGLVAQVFALVLLGFFYIGGPLQLRNIPVGLTITQILVIAGIPVIALRVMRIPVVDTLRLGRVKPALPLLALFLAPAATLCAALAASAQGVLIQVPESYREMMEKLITIGGGYGLPLSVLVFAVIPGVCEETLFRGFVLRGLESRFGGRSAVIWTAILFGAFHFDLYRLLPTTVLGLILGWVAWRTGRLWPSMVIHVTNNTFAVLATSLPALQKIQWLQEGGAIPVPVIAVVAVVGAAAAWGLYRMSPPGFKKPLPLPA